MTRIRAAALAAVAAVAVTAGCGSSGDASDEVVIVTVTSTPGKAGSPAAQDPGVAAAPQASAGAAQAPTCSDLTGAQAAAKWAGQVSTVHGWAWDVAHASTDEYDRCAALSWIVLPIQGGTTSSPYAIMLFHNGQYVGTATDGPQGFAPATKRISDAALEVTYRFPNAGDTNANPGGRAVSQFTWDPQQNKVVHTGQLPDDVKNGGGGASSSSGATADSNQIGGECGTAPNGWPVSAGPSTSCGFAIATAVELAKIGPPAPNRLTNPFPVVSPANGQTYMMRCAGGSDAHGGGCGSVNGNSPSAHVGFS